nr:sigma-70 family RNA polymerase sigma factor [Clostridia bacterium]
MNNEIIETLLSHHAYILHFAESKCRCNEDAEDLVSETYLAALAYIRKGGSIEYPKTWLANTFMHKYNDTLRRRYRMPAVVNFDALGDFDGGEDLFADDDDEAADLRRRVLYLTRTTREVLIRHYFGGEDVRSIARSLDIPEGTVKSRLAYGREQIRKGFGTMENYSNHIPQRLWISNSGSSGRNLEPASLVENDLIAQNLLILSYEKPLDIAELARMIGIPTVYIEPIIDKLVDGELMVRTDSGKVYTDFIIIRPEDRISRFDAQLEFVHGRYGVFRDVIKGLEDETCRIAKKQLNLRERQLMKLRRYVVFRALQNFAIHDNSVHKPHPKRKDGGAWTAVGHISADNEKIRTMNDYTIRGGHRTSGGGCDYRGLDGLWMYEFDVPMWDNPGRFWSVGTKLYFEQIRAYLWCLETGETPDDISDTIITHTNDFEACGLITHIDGKPVPDIAVMERDVYAEFDALAKSGTDELLERIGADLRELIEKSSIKTPSHITSIPDYWRQLPARGCIEMAAVREAYEHGE